MQHPGWYLIAYDVRDDHRLQQIHRALRRAAMPIQRSVFVTRATVAEVTQLLDDLMPLLAPHEDALCAWPVDEPTRWWTSGIPLLGSVFTG
ncbi:CRISPR-associated endonuclease Cas2 [Thiospirillum jenense]|uniref:CRISPR-associated endoribonuclease Cas2 n=1 Tax=Thiospirillum jenense TaxID=1653858 RepID=A0A839HEZ7_9GAMM|nr:CRISPR-associated endonuclease Cas2 [Thiospirillum jenense]MBB1125599.1 CRISPR-associated endonuclease Cas2 [Thiospirillum jenense]